MEKDRGVMQAHQTRSWTSSFSAKEISLLNVTSDFVISQANAISGAL